MHIGIKIDVFFYKFSFDRFFRLHNLTIVLLGKQKNGSDEKDKKIRLKKYRLGNYQKKN